MNRYTALFIVSLFLLSPVVEAGKKRTAAGILRTQQIQEGAIAFGIILSDVVLPFTIIGFLFPILMEAEDATKNSVKRSKLYGAIGKLLKSATLAEENKEEKKQREPRSVRIAKQYIHRVYEKYRQDNPLTHLVEEDFISWLHYMNTHPESFFYHYKNLERLSVKDFLQTVLKKDEKPDGQYVKINEIEKALREIKNKKKERDAQWQDYTTRSKVDWPKKMSLFDKNQLRAMPEVFVAAIKVNKKKVKRIC